MKDLTKAEEQVMHALWKLEKAFVKDVIEEFPEPKPAYNTVSTIIRILEKKEFVDHKAFGKTYQYFPIVSKEDYTKHTAGQLVDNYFGGSFKNLVSFFVKDNDMTVKEMDELMKVIESKKNENE
ncbi:MAG: BlaI/MecI/CopY family transcriptional regulator [Flavobacteriales bacterium]|jgi:predicted transcriptional regulator|nr:BlaI/MecI/CopY family transcriptional regulator [Flavobacteriales bacterium]MCB9191888.1 BlaI/MecI/CopY family transcriptional regulator [Flavobacteriales bacterium]MCB9204691.1 BlaI/MecI/CopY family transcriptional regulator [Flavobacteriales bacterium]